MTKEICDMGEPNYYAVIPAEIRYNNNLTHGAKLLYGEITALCNQKGFCWASNEYFASLYQTSDRTIKNWLKSLSDNGYIYINFRYKEGTKMIESRCISLPVLVGKEISLCGEENFQRSGKNFPKGGEENCLDNNTSTNNTFNNTLKENTKRKSDIENVSLGLEFDPERLFESFWKTYPRKDSKSESKKEFLKVCKNQNIYNDIMKSLTTQVVLKKLKKNDRYTPHARTWLHQERWKDELDAEPTKPIAGTKDKYGIPIL